MEAVKESCPGSLSFGGLQEDGHTILCLMCNSLLEASDIRYDINDKPRYGTVPIHSRMSSTSGQS